MESDRVGGEVAVPLTSVWGPSPKPLAVPGFSPSLPRVATLLAKCERLGKERIPEKTPAALASLACTLIRMPLCWATIYF